jgi:hypothetical protein
MASTTPATVPEFDESSWDLVHEEAPDQLKFEEIGESYVLQYVGSEVITPPPSQKQIEKGEEPSPFTQLRFREANGNPIVTNAGYELRESFAQMDPPCWVKIQYVKNVDTGEATPMKSFKVWQAPANANNKR